jgi:hypothetical protein
MSVKRVTISIDSELIKQIKDRQAQLIKSTDKTVSFSSVLADLVKKSLEEKQETYPRFCT